MVTNVRTSMQKEEVVSIMVVCRSYVIPARGIRLLAKYPDTIVVVHKQGDWVHSKGHNCTEMEKAMLSICTV
jgi:hypothetical protein